MKGLFAALACASLSACSASDFIPDDPDTDLEPGSYAALEDVLGTLGEGAEQLEPTGAANLPSGTAEYNGVMSLEVGETDEEEGTFLLGQVSMVADLDGVDPVTGMATDFRDEEENEYEGSLLMGNATIDPSADPEGEVEEHQVTLQVAGSLDGPGEEWEIVGDAEGDFYGANGEYTYGSVTGTACTVAQACGTVDGGYIASTGLIFED